MANIGIKLKKSREKQGFDYDYVSQKTKIHIKMLNALEEEDFEYFKSPFYLRSFLEKYIDFLRIDKAQIMAELDLVLPRLRYGDKKYSKPASGYLFSYSDKLILVFKVLVIAVLVVFSLYFVFTGVAKLLAVFISEKPQTYPEQIDQEKQVVTTVEIKPAQETKKNQVVPLELTIISKEDCWIELRADNSKIFGGVLKTGKKETWSAQNEFELHVGEISRLVFILNGKELKPVGRGMTKGIKITSEGIRLP